MRSTVFNLVFKSYCLVTLVVALPLTLLPRRTGAAWILRTWARGVLALMRTVAGIRVEVRGREHIPADRPVVFAGKHQSEADGIVVLALVPNLAVVAMRELARIPLAGRLLRKLEMILVDTGGGAGQRATLVDGSRAVHGQGRSILIYPEGTLMAVGTRERYRAGVYHVARDLGTVVVPIATNMGLSWDRRKARKRPGTVVVEFLPPMEPGPDKAAFMARLEAAIETRSDDLAAEGRKVNGRRTGANAALPVAAPARRIVRRRPSSSAPRRPALSATPPSSDGPSPAP
ncbi:MAG: lysophospholipid acyltransferase family protein [Bauldia litoralis]